MGSELDRLFATLDEIPRLGLVKSPSPVERLRALEGPLGLAWLGVKRDDQLEVWHGGTKIRKLDYLLAVPRFRDAKGWVSFGATGSGHLVALTSAATALEKTLDVHMFFEPVSEGVLENLAYTISGPTRIHYSPSRIQIGLFHPSVFLSPEWHGLPVIPPGASTPIGSIGVARGALELARQVAAGLLPEPQHLYVPFGSGGTVAGLWAGLALSPLRPVIHAVSTVERIFSPKSGLEGLARKTARELAERGLPTADLRAINVHVIRDQLGDGYGETTPGSLAATSRLHELGLAGEPIYSGKAFAGLLANAERHRSENVIFWLTPRRAGALPTDVRWRERLPQPLARKLEAKPVNVKRRRLFVGAAAAIVAGTGALRLSSPPALETPPFEGEILGRSAAYVLSRAAEVIVPGGPSDRVASNVDRFLVSQPDETIREVEILLAVVDQLPPFGGLTRFSRKSLPEREAALARAFELTGAAGLLYRGLRDLVMLGTYQEPSTWPSISYPGTWIDDRPRQDPYRALLDEDGMPRSLVT
ncbi:MAG: pyridoxal-phosphate dependent enzyme [Deltaproteobacteria bacterium]|nr:pyridoxal-phosphate dependent enzyme [Deltaproteobacteria bacterium]